MIWLLMSPFASAQTGDDHRLEEAVLQTPGKRNTVMVLWPRVIPHTEDSDVQQAARDLQHKLDAIARRAAPLTPRQVAPEPQRVCSRPRGCKGYTLGVLVGQEGGGCVAVAWVGEVGKGARHLVPLAGKVDISTLTLPFRAHPEDVITVREFVPCKDLVGSIDEAPLIDQLRRWTR